MLRFIAAAAVGLLLSSGAEAQTDCSPNSNRVATVVFPASLNADDLPVPDGVTLRATDPRGHCVGEIVWSEAEGHAMVLRGGDASLSDPGGLLDGEEATVSAVINGDAMMLTVAATELGGGGDTDLTFSSGAVFVVADLGVPVGAEAAHADEPLLTLNGLAPNPATDTATLRYRLGAAARVASDVFDMLGRRLLHGEPAERPAGDHALPLSVARLPAGVYLARLTVHGAAEAAVVTRRFTVTR